MTTTNAQGNPSNVNPDKTVQPTAPDKDAMDAKIATVIAKLPKLSTFADIEKAAMVDGHRTIRATAMRRWLRDNSEAYNNRDGRMVFDKSDPDDVFMLTLLLSRVGAGTKGGMLVRNSADNKSVAAEFRKLAGK